MAGKTSSPLGDRSGVASTGAPEELGTRATEELGAEALEELVPDDRLLQENKTKVKTKRGVQQRENKKTTHR